MVDFPVFFCEATEFVFLRETYTCPACNHITRAGGGRYAKADVPEYSGTKTCPCDNCGAEALISSWAQRPILRRTDTDVEVGGEDKLPVGAVYDADWFHEFRRGPDGRCLMVVLPTGFHWFIDGRASNCTMPDDNTHRCWVRHGFPEDGTLHVDKDGQTCQAGGGSIAVTNYHGFLHDGRLMGC